MWHNIKKYLQQYAMMGIFGVLCFAAISFLLVQGGVWSYVDAVFLLKSKEYFLGYIEHAQLFEMGTSMFGYDSSFVVSRLLSVELADLLRSMHYTYGVIMLYVLFMIVNFITVRVLLRYIFPDQYAFLGALFFTFNPVALFFLNKPGFLFAYSSLPIVLLACVKYFYDRNANTYLWIIVSAAGMYFLVSYPRITGLYGTVILILVAFHYRAIFTIIADHWKKAIFYIACHIVLLLPVIYPIATYYTQDARYFSGAGNYAQSSEKFSSNLYEAILARDFSRSFFVTEISDNFGRTFYDHKVFRVISLAGVLVMILLSIRILTRKIRKMHYKDHVALGMLGGLVISIGTAALARFTDISTFKIIAYSAYPFIAGNTQWMYVIHVVVMTYLISWLAYTYRRAYNVTVLIVVAYCLLSVYPLMNYAANQKLHTVAWTDIPDEYRETFYGQKDFKARAALFFPTDQINNNLIFTWSPYPIDITFNGAYKPLVSNNSRIASSKQSMLWSALHDREHALVNAYILGLEDVFVFKDIRNDTEGFDFFPRKDYVGASGDYYEKMLQEKHVFLKEDHVHFAHFLDKDYAKMDYFIYSPQSVLFTEIQQFFMHGAVARDRRPLFMDTRSFNGNAIATTVDYAQNVKIDHKYDVGNTTKYPIAISSWDKQKPLLLHMNQTFGINWKIKWVDKEHYDAYVCKDEWETFTLSRNAICRVNMSLVNVKDLALLFAPQVAAEKHFEGNFVGNTWRIDPQDIPDDLTDQKELYAVIVYEKQIYFVWILLFATSFLICLGVCAMGVYIKQKRFIRNNKDHVQ